MSITKLEKLYKEYKAAWSYEIDAKQQIKDQMLAVMPQILAVLRAVDRYSDNGQEIDTAMGRLKKVLK